MTAISLPSAFAEATSTPNMTQRRSRPRNMRFLVDETIARLSGSWKRSRSGWGIPGAAGIVATDGRLDIDECSVGRIVVKMVPFR